MTEIQHSAIRNIYIKRDDLFSIAGVNGGKVRSCFYLATHPDVPKGLVTAGARSSPQANIVARLARHLGIPCRIHMPSGEMSEQGLLAQEAGAEIIQHRAGYNSVIVKRARDDALRLGWREIPFGMECWEAVNETAKEVEPDFQYRFRRIVIPVGSGMSLCGVLTGLRDTHQAIPVLGVIVGASPLKRLNKYAPMNWQNQVTLVNSGFTYHTKAKDCYIGDIELDSIYEAKCLRFLTSGDLLWVVGSRNKRFRNESNSKESMA